MAKAFATSHRSWPTFIVLTAGSRQLWIAPACLVEEPNDRGTTRRVSAITFRSVPRDGNPIKPLRCASTATRLRV
jgi:hypothetical protein